MWIRSSVLSACDAPPKPGRGLNEVEGAGRRAVGRAVFWGFQGSTASGHPFAVLMDAVACFSGLDLNTTT